MKWNESGFRPPLCTYRLNWARRTSWGWWDDWDDTVLQTQDSKFEPWRSEAEHAASWSRRLPTILTFTRGWGRNIFVSFKPPRPGTEPRTLAWKAAVLTTTLGPPPYHESIYCCKPTSTCFTSVKTVTSNYSSEQLILSVNWFFLQTAITAGGIGRQVTACISSKQLLLLPNSSNCSLETLEGTLLEYHVSIYCLLEKLKVTAWFLSKLSESSSITFYFLNFRPGE